MKVEIIIKKLPGVQKYFVVVVVPKKIDLCTAPEQERSHGHPSPHSHNSENQNGHYFFVFIPVICPQAVSVVRVQR